MTTLSADELDDDYAHVLLRDVLCAFVKKQNLEVVPCCPRLMAARSQEPVHQVCAFSRPPKVFGGARFPTSVPEGQRFPMQLDRDSETWCAVLRSANPQSVLAWLSLQHLGDSLFAPLAESLFELAVEDGRGHD